MKTNRGTTVAIAVTLFGVLVTTLQLPAQELTQQGSKNHHQYQFIDLGTLGGPNSYLPLLPPYHDFLPSASLSQSGMFAGFADTATPDFSPFCFNADCFASHVIAWRNGTMTDLGALPGPVGISSAATWISKSGLIAGFSQNGEIDPLNPGFPEVRAVLWKHGKITDLGTLEEGHESAAFALNNRGQVVGVATNAIPDPYSIVGFTTQTRAFLWENGEMQDLGTLPGGTDAMALFVNERGQVVGQSYAADSIPLAPHCTDAPLSLFAFIWEKGQMTDLKTLGGHCTFPYSLNNRGQVIGQSNLEGDTASHPFLWQRGKMRDLGTLGGTYGYAEWLNDAGTVVGSATNQGDQALIAFLWRNGKMTNLGTLPGNACSAANAINASGQIVGGSGFYDAPFFPTCTDTVEHAVLWENGKILDLNNFVPPGTDLTLTEAYFINDRGEISGFGTLSNGDQHTFLLIPCDENHPDVEGCSHSLVDAATATRESPAPVMQEPTTTAPRTLRPFGRRGLTFNPGQTGAQNARSPIAESGGSPQTASPSSTHPVAVLSPTSLRFQCRELIGGGCYCIPLRPGNTTKLTNTGNASLSITSITATGHFSEVNACGKRLGSGKSCTISVGFHPPDGGIYLGKVLVSDNAAGSPQTVSLTGGAACKPH